MGRIARFCGASLIAVAALQAQAAGRAPDLPARFDRPIVGGQLDPRLFHEAVLIYTNAERRAHGRPPFKGDLRLQETAAGHAANMARLRIHSHRLPIPGEGRLVQRMDRNGIRYHTAGENIAMDKVYRLLGRPISLKAEGCHFTYGDTGAPVPVHSYATLAQSVVARWMASPKHRASILSTDFRRLGSGFAIDPKGSGCGDVYAVQNFAG